MSKPLCKQFNALVLHLASKVLPKGFDVSPNAPSTFEALTAHYEQTGRVCVWEGASDATIFADPEVNYAFRAWHDALHIAHCLPFTLEGEIAVARIQCKQIAKLYGHGRMANWFRSLVWIEVIDQKMHHDLSGVFPHDQMSFTIARLWQRGEPTHSPVASCHA